MLGMWQTINDGHCQFPGVGAVTVIPAKDDSGIIKIILMDQNGVPASKQIQDAVYDYIMRPDSESDRLAPPNAVLEITAPETVVVNISAVVYWEKQK